MARLLNPLAMAFMLSDREMVRVVSCAPLADFRGLGAIHVGTSVHAVKNPRLSLENLRADACKQQSFSVHFSEVHPSDAQDQHSQYPASVTGSSRQWFFSTLPPLSRMQKMPVMLHW
jgi:hypothetical protein